MVQLVPGKGAETTRAVSRRPPAKKSLLRRWRLGFWRLGRRFGFGRVFALGLLAFLVMLRGWDPTLIETFRLKIFDFYQVLQPRIGQTPDFLLDDEVGGGRPYVAAISLGNAGIPLAAPDIRSLPLSADPLFFTSVLGLLPLQQNFTGVFPASGQSVASKAAAFSPLR